ncbi:HK97-gp10 family putative phage morphogenesis protein [Paraburkholderia graminis]|uniref:HK97-gp10 family putative phage morphogenesis protein n=1 Tax=Paraburkholderia graminis TaxID=60548 RepID=UPI0038B6EE99
MARALVVQNPDALTAALDNAERAAAESTLRKAAAAGATVFYREIKVRAMPYYRTGTLERSIIVTYVAEDSVEGNIATYMVTFKSAAWYARLLEYGTSKMAARPFIRPSYEAKKQDAGKAVINKIQESVDNGG